MSLHALLGTAAHELGLPDLWLRPETHSYVFTARAQGGPSFRWGHDHLTSWPRSCICCNGMAPFETSPPGLGTIICCVAISQGQVQHSRDSWACRRWLPRLKNSTDKAPPPVQALDSVQDSVMLVDTSIAEAAKWTLQFANENWVRMTGEHGIRATADRVVWEPLVCSARAPNQI